MLICARSTRLFTIVKKIVKLEFSARSRIIPACTLFLQENGVTFFLGAQVSEEQNKLTEEGQAAEDAKLQAESVKDKLATDAIQDLPIIKPRKRGKFPRPNILDRMDGL